MSGDELVQNYDYIAANIKDYIEDDKLVSIFELDDVKIILEGANLASNDFITLMDQYSSRITTQELYKTLRNANVSIEDDQEVISTLVALKKYMKLGALDGIINYLNQKPKEVADSSKRISELENSISRIQTELNDIRNHSQPKEDELPPAPKPQTARKNVSGIVVMTEENERENIINIIAGYKNSNDFESIYNFMNDLSENGNQEMLKKACEKGLNEKKEKENGNNVFIEACDRGNLQLVRNLFACGCNKESKNNIGQTPLIRALRLGHLDVVKYLVSVGANIEAKDNAFRCTPLVYASYKGHLDVVKYLISCGADKNVKTRNGHTPLKNAKGAVRNYLISIGAK
ncbi:ankyrin repeat protein, putative [Trichomonas vaginalis G3]|uniref:Ankyrin repeat protein, putative n=1 Tax=Trichomonas vaginalis (strain ATCC PRA-98 / G3) TaxID=412133 RepID=A2FXV0_TRIV3|nr:protein ubiquitination [Trichomonas vaginalis G3]EAX90254.1 ankyrin repeat protein, putative [Trichomonas vaginalis G3]KAI5499856.1 protein ubiquitination [Trichomonas vaginalis G3]|eukprot:XP_001303184.1 ankyrin repeat protein [Trichomonas vaginalis G3]